MATPAQDRFGYPLSARPPGGGAFGGTDRAAYRSAFGASYLAPGDPRQRGGPRAGPPGSRTYQGRSTDVTSPYVNTNFLGSGFPHPLPVVPPQSPPSPSFQPVQPPGSRPSWDLAGVGALLGPYFHIPIREDYQLSWKLREAIPLIDAAIMHLKRLIGFPEVEASPRLKKDIDDFLRYLPVNRMQTGAETWLQSHLDNSFTYGRAHTEIVLTADRRDVFSLVEVYTPTCGLRPTFDGYALNVVQYQFGGGVPLTLVPELLLTSVHDFRGDDPNGNSLIASLPFVSQILIKIYDAMRQQWERFGCPNYWVNWEPPENWNDPEGTQGSAILAPMQQSLYQSDVDRANGKIRHYFTLGKISLEVMGATGEVLEFSDTARAFCEQITAKTGIPPFLLGFSWASTERMSTAQAKTLTETIQAARAMVEPQIRQLIELRQRLVGRTGPFALKWPRVSLQDMIDESRSRQMDATAEQIELANWDRKVRLGLNSIEEFAKAIRPDLEDVPLEKVRARLTGKDGLPVLPAELPTFTPAVVGGDFPGGPGAAGVPPGAEDPSQGGPRDETTSRTWGGREVLTNGRH